MTANQVATWLTLAGMLLSAGIWLGNLAGRVSALEAEQRFLHGTVTVPKE